MAGAHIDVDKSMTHVIVVEDDTTLRTTIIELLQDEGFEAEAARDGQEALHLLEHTPDLEVVLCDIQMPNMDGITLLQRLHSAYPHVAVIMLTGYGTVESAVEAMRHGAVNYLLKPINAEQLLDNIRDALRIREEQLRKQAIMGQIIDGLHNLGLSDTPGRSPFQPRIDEAAAGAQVRNALIHWGELTVDQGRLCAFCRGRLLELTPTEFEIVRCLVQAEGRVVVFEDIAFHLQGNRLNRDEARRMLASHLSNLRAKLHAAGCTNCLVNSRGRGYSLKT